jgi:hypothetical protein
MALADASWQDLLDLRTWTPLRQTGIETTRLSENVRRVSRGKYLVVVESDLSGDVAGGPYVTMVAWAETDGAALRAVDAALERDAEPDHDQMPPPELLPEPTASGYATILSALKRRGESVLESGEYRIATDGAFLHKVIRATAATYYFRSPVEIGDEKPFAVTHRIRS